MALIEWSDDLSVKVKELDLQHQKVIAMINELNDGMKQGRGKDVIARIIDDLSSYAGSHFAAEEKYFDRYSYPGATAHKARHQEYVRKVSGMKADLESGKLALTIEVMNFLKDWWKGHIQGTDRNYSSFFNEKGLR